MSNAQIILTNTKGLSSTGTIRIATTDVDQTIISLDFTANNRATNTLSVTLPIGTRNIPIGTQVWVNQNTGVPYMYTVWDNKIFFDVPVQQDYHSGYILLDYYKTRTRLVSLYEELPETFRGVYKDYIVWRLKKLKDRTTNDKDVDYKRFIEQITSSIGLNYTGQYMRID